MPTLMPPDTWSRTMPACFFSSQQWTEWKHLARRSGHRGSHCADCTPEFKAQMLTERRCTEPEVIFTRDEDGFLHGTKPTPPAKETP